MALYESELIPTASGSEWQVSPKDAGKPLEQKGFVNLLKCTQLKDVLLKDEKALPLGSVLVYEPVGKNKKPGDVRMKTPAGCFGAAEKVTAEEFKRGTNVDTQIAQLNKNPANGDKVDALQEEKRMLLMILNQKAGEEYQKTGGACLNNPGFKLVGVYVKNVN
jgi:hypothetical protein